MLKVSVELKVLHYFLFIFQNGKYLSVITTQSPQIRDLFMSPQTLTGHR